MAQTRAAAHLGEHIGRIGHALHAACHDDPALSGAQLVHAHHDGLHAGPAHLVDRRAWYGDWQPGPQRCLTRRGLALARGQDAAHQHLVHIVSSDTSAFQRTPDRGRAEFRRLHAREFTLKSTHWRARCTHDHDCVRHDPDPLSNGVGATLPGRPGDCKPRPAPRPLTAPRPCADAAPASRDRPARSRRNPGSGPEACARRRAPRSPAERPRS